MTALGRESLMGAAVFLPGWLREKKQCPSTQLWKDTMFCPQAFKKVGVRGFELPTSTSRTWHANQLRYTPCFFSAAKLTQ